IRRPFVMPNRLFERFLAVERFFKVYEAETVRIATTCLKAESFNPRVDAALAMITEAERAAGVPHRPLPKDLPAEADIKVWAARRRASIEAQRTGKSDGYAPYWQHGLFGNGPRPATRPATRPTTRPTRTST